MSTRSTLLIEQPNGTYKNYYRHCDGYPQCAGRFLIDLVTFVAGQKALGVGKDCLSLFMNILEEYCYSVDEIRVGGIPSFMQKPYYEETTTEIATDVEYIYLLEGLSSNNINDIKLYCYHWEYTKERNLDAMRLSDLNEIRTYGKRMVEKDGELTFA